MHALADIQPQFEATSYEILGVIGEGGMGTVYRARHRRLNRRVVIKVLKAHLGGADLRDRFRLEAQSSAQLQHDNIINVTDCGSLVDDSPFLVMDALEGLSLKELLKKEGGHLPVKRVRAITRQILAGLGYAHDRGVVHRDIKPANIFICDNDRVKILDFGVAKLTAPVTGVDPLHAPTADGALMGTPRYMAPEQARGRTIDGRADLYAVGIVMYRMLTGEVPFGDAKKLSDLLLARCTKLPPAPSTVAPQRISAPLDELVMRAIAIDPRDRFKDAYEMAGAVIRLGTAFKTVAFQFGLDQEGTVEEVPATTNMTVLSELSSVKLDPTVADGGPAPAPTKARQGSAPSAREDANPPSLAQGRQLVDGAAVAFLVMLVVGFVMRLL